MQTIAGLLKQDREALFRNSADRMGISLAIMEKDFWVSYMLDYLFSRNRWKENFAFKGGTSLSKAFGLIDRFSEDVDLILDWRVLGFKTMEPWENRSKSKQAKFNRHANNLTAAFLKDKFLATMIKDLSIELKGF